MSTQVNIKSFDKYIRKYSKDPKTFMKRIALATSSDDSYDFFENVNNIFDINRVGSDIPVIISEGFNFTPVAINESNIHTYSGSDFPRFNQICEDLGGNDFIPKSTSKRAELKKLKFPILAMSEDSSDEYKTIGKLRKSEKLYSRYREKIAPRTLFKVLSFKGEPITITEHVNRLPLDVDLNRFRYLDGAEKISKTIHEKYGLDFYVIELLEAKDKLYLNGVSKINQLSPHQAYHVYEKAYIDYYQSKLPNWFKKQLFENTVLPYYEQKNYDSMMVKTRHTLDYSKYLNK